jgi:hypothetical protein
MRTCRQGWSTSYLVLANDTDTVQSQGWPRHAPRPFVDRGLTGEALGREIERPFIKAIAALEPHD